MCVWILGKSKHCNSFITSNNPPCRTAPTPNSSMLLQASHPSTAWAAPVTAWCVRHSEKSWLLLTWEHGTVQQTNTRSTKEIVPTRLQQMLTKLASWKANPSRAGTNYLPRNIQSFISTHWNNMEHKKRNYGLLPSALGQPAVLNREFLLFGEIPWPIKPLDLHI